MNEIVKKLSLARDNLIPEMQLIQDAALRKPEWITNSACEAFTKNKKKIWAI